MFAALNFVALWISLTLWIKCRIKSFKNKSSFAALLSEIIITKWVALLHDVGSNEQKWECLTGCQNGHWERNWENCTLWTCFLHLTGVPNCTDITTVKSFSGHGHVLSHSHSHSHYHSHSHNHSHSIAVSGISLSSDSVTQRLKKLDLVCWTGSQESSFGEGGYHK